MKICEKCNKTYSGEFVFCPKCGGTLIEERYSRCPDCKKVVDDDYIYCPYCGCDLDKNTDDKVNDTVKDNNFEGNNDLTTDSEDELRLGIESENNKDHKEAYKHFGKAISLGNKEALIWYIASPESNLLENDELEKIQPNVNAALEYDHDFKFEETFQKMCDIADSLEISGLLKEDEYESTSKNEFYKVAFKLREYAVKQGIVEAMYAVAWAYEYGMGVDENYNKAFINYEKAANQGHIDSMYNLGNMYLDGKGVAKNLEKAKELFRKAAGQGSAEAKDALDRLKDLVDSNNEEDLNQNEETATPTSSDISTFKSLQQKILDILNTLSNRDKEVMELRLGLKDGWVRTLEETSQHFGVTCERIRQIEAKFHRRMRSKDIPSDTIDQMVEILQKYPSILKFIEEEPEKIVKLKNESENNNSDINKNDEEIEVFSVETDVEVIEPGQAEYDLGEKYFYGKGIKKDLNKALELYKLAASKGLKVAQNDVGECYYWGYGVETDYKEAYKWYKKAADQKYSESEYNIGFMYYSGTGVKENLKRAFNWFMKAAKQGHTESLYYIGKMYDRGESVEKDTGEAIKWYRKAAKQGNEDAQSRIVEMYFEDDGIGIEEEEAFHWLHEAAERGNDKAKKILEDIDDTNDENDNQEKEFNELKKKAEHGDVKAQFKLAYMYDQGEGTEEDKEEAIKWYLKSAEQGNVDAQIALGSMYSNGDGTEVNRYEAFEWYKKAADKGNNLAIDELENDFGIAKNSSEKELEKVRGELLFELGEKYFNRDGIKKDLTKATEYYRKAVDHGNEKAKKVLDNEVSKLLVIEKLKESAELGDIKAQVKLADMYKDGEIYDVNLNAFKWYMKAAEHGDTKAQFEIGEMYFYGYSGDSTDIDVDIKEALKWYTKAAEQGNVDAQNRLGDMYYSGDGVEEDEEKAFKWHMKAAEQGNPDALYSIASYYEMGVYVEENEYEAFEWYKKAADAGCDYAVKEIKNEYGITEYSSEIEINKIRGELLLKLGNKYYEGSEVEKDDRKANEYYRKAAELGNSDAQCNLGQSYLFGTGVEKNYSIAATFLKSAAEQGVDLAQFNLGLMYENGDGVPQNFEEASKWYFRAASQGYDRAQDKLAWFYYSGTGVVKNYDLAAYWCKQAAKQNYAHAQKNLGIMYEYGYGVSPDIEEAVEWLRKAVDNGNKEAVEDLKRAEVKLNKLNKGNHYPHLKLSEVSRNIIGLAANNVFNDSLWQAFGFNKAPIRGSIFNHFINSEQLAKETFLSREFMIASLGIYVRLLHKQTDFNDVEYIKYLSDFILDYKDVSRSLRFNDIYEAKRYFGSYIKEYVQEDKSSDDVFLNHCRYNNIAKDSKVIVGSQLVCNSLSDFLEHKLQEINEEYYIEDDVTSYRFYKSNTDIKTASPQQTFKSNPEKILKMEGIKGIFYIVRYHLWNSSEIKQKIFYDKSQAEAHFNQRDDRDAISYSQIELLECDEGNIKELAKKRFEVMYRDDY